eukprot:CAMPEP_0194313612 /NCGR_PEP_ID=MMETSP0171-20130528/10475_1 /TAXON_ID=218684 /ORGANISM="Corethron pennatum, Strain L29A3" /LENGTH=79 /DNA_ID=CAMNT_0039068641 /DNA_START=189 /DNA_END=424 /DNA_ORIENTATION=-
MPSPARNSSHSFLRRPAFSPTAAAPRRPTPGAAGAPPPTASALPPTVALSFYRACAPAAGLWTATTTTPPVALAVGWGG